MVTSQVLGNAIKKYGKTHQLLKAIEEMSELINELCDNIDGDDNKLKIIEELVDCEIMFEQICMIFEITESEKEYVRNWKITRLANTIKESE